jgi:hypothetical protein
MQQADDTAAPIGASSIGAAPTLAPFPAPAPIGAPVVIGSQNL